MKLHPIAITSLFPAAQLWLERSDTGIMKELLLDRSVREAKKEEEEEEAKKESVDNKDCEMSVWEGRRVDISIHPGRKDGVGRPTFFLSIFSLTHTTVLWHSRSLVWKCSVDLSSSLAWVVLVAGCWAGWWGETFPLPPSHLSDLPNAAEREREACRQEVQNQQKRLRILM